MKLVIVSIVFIYGVILGSFYNVVGFRVPMGAFFKRQRSFCPSCNRQLTYAELIPLFSFIYQRGKCKSCKAPISVVYPVFEGVTGIAFALSYLKFGPTLDLLYSLILVSFLIVLSISDIHYMVIPNILFLIFGIPLIVFHVLDPRNSILNSLLSVLLVSGVVMIVSIINRGKMGMGDVKLFILLGFLFAPEYIPLLFLLSSVFACLYFLYLYIKGELSYNRKIPFGPFISLAAIVLLFFGKELLEFIM